MMEQIALARRQLNQKPSRFLEEPDKEATGWLMTLLTQGCFDDWIALAKLGAYDAVAAILSDTQTNAQGEMEPDDPVIRAAGLVLVLGFFFPRSQHWSVDLLRARQILLGEGGFPQLSHKAIPAFYGLPDEQLFSEELGYEEESADWRCGHIALVARVMHPLASALVAEQLGLSSAAFRAVIEGDVFLDEAGEARLFPWYREEDEEEREAAAARAAQLGVSMPEAFLDEPYEGSWYLARTGGAFLASWAAETGHTQDFDAAFVDVVPVLPIRQRPFQRMPGGYDMSGDLEHAYEVLCSRNNFLQHRVDRDLEGAAAWITTMLQEAIRLVLFSGGAALGDWSPQSPNHSRSTALTGAPEPREYHEPPSPSRAMKLQQLRFVDRDSMLLIFPNTLMHMSMDGEVKGSFPYWGELTHVSPQGLVLIHHGGELHVLDLDTQQWCRDITPDELIAQGRLSDEVFPPKAISAIERDPYDNSHHWLSGIFTPDHRFYLEVDAEMIGGIYRHEDRRMMAEGHDVMPPFHDARGYSETFEEYDEYDESGEYDEYDSSGEYDESDESDAFAPDELDFVADDFDEDEFRDQVGDMREERGGRGSRHRGAAQVTTLLTADTLPALTGEAEQRFVIDGVTFAISSGLKPSVDENRRLCFVLCEDQWRFFAGNTVTHGGKPLARFETPVFAGAFDVSGERLLVLSRHHVHLIWLGGTPRVLRHIPLTAAFDAIRVLTLEEGGDA